MNYTKEQLIDALVAEWEYLCHDDYDPEDPTPEEYRKDLNGITYSRTIELKKHQLEKVTLLMSLWRITGNYC